MKNKKKRKKKKYIYIYIFKKSGGASLWRVCYQLGLPVWVMLTILIQDITLKPEIVYQAYRLGLVAF